MNPEILFEFIFETFHGGLQVSSLLDEFLLVVYVLELLFHGGFILYVLVE